MDSKRNATLRLSSTQQPFQPPPSSLQNAKPPPSVQAVLVFGYPKNIVMEAYCELASDSLRHAKPASYAVTAAMLMTKVDAMLERQGSSGGDSLSRWDQQCVFSGETLVSESRTEEVEEVEEDGSGDETGGSSSSSAAATTAVTSTALTTSDQIHPPTTNTIESLQSVDSSTSPTSSTTQDVITTSTITTTTTNTTSISDQIPAVTSLTNTIPADPRSSTVSTSTATVSASTSEIHLAPPTSAASHESQPTPIPVQSSMPVNSPTQVQSTRVSFPSSHSAQQPHSSTTRSEACSEAAQRSSPAEDRAKEKKRLVSRVRTLREENRRLRARRVCRQCLEREVNLTFLPCGHFAYCQQCGSVFDTCPLCAKTILADVKTFLS